MNKAMRSLIAAWQNKQMPAELSSVTQSVE